MTPTKKLAEIVLARDEAVEAYQEKLARIVCHHHESLGKLLDALPQIKADALAQLVPDLTSRLDSTIPQMVAALAEAARDELVTDQSARLSILAEDAQRTRDDIAKFLAEGEARVDGKLAALNDHSKKLIESAEIAAELAAQNAVQSALAEPTLKQFVVDVISSQPQPDPQPAPASSENVLVGLFKGWFTPGDDAKRGELWVYNGSTYLCTADTDMPPMPGPIDTQIENWAMFAAAGRPGAPGTSSTASSGASLPDQTGNNGKFLTTDGSAASWGTPAGSGDMVLASVQTVTGAKTFNDAKLLLRNVADTFSSWFTNAATAARTWTLPNASGTIALTSDITGTNSGTNTGDQTIQLTGDVTGSGTGSFAATIAASAVTLAKMANMATASVFYRKTAGSGAPEVQTLATLKTDLAVTATDVGLGSVTNDAQTKAAIVPNTAPSAGQLLVGNAGGTAYAPVSSSGDVTIASTGATTIGAGKVTLAMQANMATASVIYRKTAGSGAPEVNTLATLKTDLAMTFADIGAGVMAANQTFGENTEIILDAALSADGKYCGLTEDGTAGEAVSFGDCLYFKAADSKWWKAKADAASTSGDVKIGMCVLAASANGATKLLLWGKLRVTAFPTLTISAPVHISSATGGAVVVAAPTATDSVTRRIGFANTAAELYFNPSNDYLTHT